MSEHLVFMKETMEKLQSEDWSEVEVAYRELGKYSQESLLQALYERYPELENHDIEWSSFKLIVGVNNVNGISYYNGEYTTPTGKELCVFEEDESLSVDNSFHNDESENLLKLIHVVRYKYWDSAFWLTMSGELFAGKAYAINAVYFYNSTNLTIVHADSFENSDTLETVRIDPFDCSMEAHLEMVGGRHTPYLYVSIAEKWEPKTFPELQEALLIIALFSNINFDSMLQTPLPNPERKKKVLHEVLRYAAAEAYPNIPSEQWKIDLDD